MLVLEIATAIILAKIIWATGSILLTADTETLKTFAQIGGYLAFIGLCLFTVVWIFVH